MPGARGAAAAALVALLALAGPTRAAQRPAQPPRAPAPEAAAPAAERPAVTRVELHLPAGADAAGLQELVAVQPGQPLSLRAVRRSVERLWATGRFSDVVVRRQAEPQGVALVFELTPVAVLASLTVDGNAALSDEQVRQATGLEEKQPVDPDRLDGALAAVRAAYARKGYHAARVEAEERPGPEGLVVALVVEEGAPTRVAGITASGDPGLPLPRLLEALGLSAGAVLDEEVLQGGAERLRELLRRERYWRARVEPARVQRSGVDAWVVVPVAAGPRFDFHFRGNHRVPDALLRAVLTYEGAEPLDGTVEARLARRLRDFYRHRGFLDARVRPRELRRPDGREAVVVFEVEEGQPVVVTGVDFAGNQALDGETLRAGLAERVAAAAPRPGNDAAAVRDPLQLAGRGRPDAADAPEPDASRVFVEEAYLGAADGLTEAYRERGYLRARVRLAGLERDVEAGTARVRMEVEEGPQALLADVAWEGDEAALGLATVGPLLPRGAPLNSDAVERARQLAQEGLVRRGHLYARVDVGVDVGGDGREARATFRASAGPRVRVGQVIVRGLSRTDEALVRANVRLRGGEVLEPAAMYASQRALAQLGIFRHAAVRLLSPELSEPVKDVVVDVRERPRFAGEVSGGYFLVEGPRLRLDATYPNIDGRGLTLSGRGQLNYVGLSALALGTEERLPQALEGTAGVGGRGTLSLSQSRLYLLLPLQVGARLDLVGERMHEPAFVTTRYATVGSLDWATTRWLSAALQYEVEHNRVSDEGVGSLAANTGLVTGPERLRFPTGQFTLHTARLTLSADFRDEPVTPRRGLLVSTTGELTRDLHVAPQDEDPYPVRFAKLQGAVTGYVPLAGRAVLALSVRGGTVRPLVKESRTIGPKRFYLGGPGTLRGFGEDRLLPEDVREELRREVEPCRGYLSPVGCSSATARRLLEGRQLLSQGGELFALAKAELRLPVAGSLDLGLFTEAGNLWEDRDKADLRKLRPVAGAGLRYVTPVGPVALDVGINLDRDRVVNESAYQVHFSIGLF